MTPKEYIKFMQEKDDGQLDLVLDSKSQLYYRDSVVGQFEFWNQTEELLEAISNGKQKN